MASRPAQRNEKLMQKWQVVICHLNLDDDVKYPVCVNNVTCALGFHLLTAYAAADTVRVLALVILYYR